MEEILKQILEKIDALNERMSAHDKTNKHEFKQLNKKLDSISDVVAKSMEDITDIKGKLENQGNELKVLKGAR